MRIKAKTSPTGYIATLDTGANLIEFPVARFDDEGWALICNVDGLLVRAANEKGFLATAPLGQVSR